MDDHGLDEQLGRERHHLGAVGVAPGLVERQSAAGSFLTRLAASRCAGTMTNAMQYDHHLLVSGFMRRHSSGACVIDGIVGLVRSFEEQRERRFVIHHTEPSFTLHLLCSDGVVVCAMTVNEYPVSAAQMQLSKALSLCWAQINDGPEGTVSQLAQDTSLHIAGLDGLLTNLDVESLKAAQQSTCRQEVTRLDLKEVKMLFCTQRLVSALLHSTVYV